MGLSGAERPENRPFVSPMTNSHPTPHRLLWHASSVSGDLAQGRCPRSRLASLGQGDEERQPLAPTRVAAEMALTGDVFRPQNGARAEAAGLAVA